MQQRVRLRIGFVGAFRGRDLRGARARESDEGSISRRLELRNESVTDSPAHMHVTCMRSSCVMIHMPGHVAQTLDEPSMTILTHLHARSPKGAPRWAVMEEDQGRGIEPVFRRRRHPVTT